VEKNWIDDSCQATNHLCPSIVHIHVYLSILVAACGSDFPLIKRNDRIHNTTLSTAYYVLRFLDHSPFRQLTCSEIQETHWDAMIDAHSNRDTRRCSSIVVRG
jgi:hypothetical protein